ncbi:MAG: hypothetical protein M0Z28_29880 [Rhodospirillales bacterium]|nr:hypothetical protein [Rhodospirillales bacterium]
MIQRKSTLAAGLWAAVAVAALALPSPARAWWRGGVFFGFPPVLPFYYAPPPVVYAPPAYYPPPPAYYPPPQGYAPPPQGYAPPPQGNASQEGQAGPVCRAGAYICPLEAPAGVGAPCSCPTNTGRAAGRVG